VIAYEFADVAGAAGFVRQAGAPSNVRAGASPLDLDRPLGVAAYRMRVGDDPLQVALLSQGRRSYAVGLRGPVADGDGTLLRDLAAVQAGGGSG
jgi:hypothetical protein